MKFIKLTKSGNFVKGDTFLVNPLQIESVEDLESSTSVTCTSGTIILVKENEEEIEKLCSEV